MTRRFGALPRCCFRCRRPQADTIKIVVPFAAGGPADTIARYRADMQARLKSDVVIENRGGAGGVIAIEQVARAPADGKTLLFASSARMSSAPRFAPQPATIRSNRSRRSRSSARADAVHRQRRLPAKTLAELIAKAKSEKMSYGSAGAGTTMHIAGRAVERRRRHEIAHVPYRGSRPRSTI